MAEKQHVTQTDVARAANVSRSTVSLVINGRAHGQIPEETRQRVLQVVKEMGYAPNVAARMLAQGTNRLIGVFTYAEFFPYETTDFFYPFLLGIERQATEEEYNLLLLTRPGDGDGRSIYREGVNQLGMADGAILMGSHPKQDEIRKLVDDGHSFVYLGRRDVPGYAFDWVASDYKRGSFTATEHLLEMGHRRIAFAGQESNKEPYEDRLAGCQIAVAHYPDAVLHVMPEDHLSDGDAMLRFLNATRVTALVCTGTVILASMLLLLEPLGVAVPDALSVVAVSDEEASFSSHVSPTHVALHSTQVGSEAVKLLVERIEGKRTKPKQVLIPCSLVLGNTVARVTR